MVKNSKYFKTINSVRYIFIVCCALCLSTISVYATQQINNLNSTNVIPVECNNSSEKQLNTSTNNQFFYSANLPTSAYVNRCCPNTMYKSSWLHTPNNDLQNFPNRLASNNYLIAPNNVFPFTNNMAFNRQQISFAQRFESQHSLPLYSNNPAFNYMDPMGYNNNLDASSYKILEFFRFNLSCNGIPSYFLGKSDDYPSHSEASCPVINIEKDNDSSIDSPAIIDFQKSNHSSPRITNKGQNVNKYAQGVPALIIPISNTTDVADGYNRQHDSKSYESSKVPSLNLNLSINKADSTLLVAKEQIPEPKTDFATENAQKHSQVSPVTPIIPNFNESLNSSVSMINGYTDLEQYMQPTPDYINEQKNIVCSILVNNPPFISTLVVNDCNKQSNLNESENYKNSYLSTNYNTDNARLPFLLPRDCPYCTESNYLTNINNYQQTAPLIVSMPNLEQTCEPLSPKVNDCANVNQDPQSDTQSDTNKIDSTVPTCDTDQQDYTGITNCLDNYIGEPSQTAEKSPLKTDTDDNQTNTILPKNYEAKKSINPKYTVEYKRKKHLKAKVYYREIRTVLEKQMATHKNNTQRLYSYLNSINLYTRSTLLNIVNHISKRSGVHIAALEKHSRELMCCWIVRNWEAASPYFRPFIESVKANRNDSKGQECNDKMPQINLPSNDNQPQNSTDPINN